MICSDSVSIKKPTSVYNHTKLPIVESFSLPQVRKLIFCLIPILNFTINFPLLFSTLAENSAAAETTQTESPVTNEVVQILRYVQRLSSDAYLSPAFQFKAAEW